MTREFELEPTDNERLANLCGPLDENLRMLESRLAVDIRRRGSAFRVSGERAAAAEGLLRELFRLARAEVSEGVQAAHHRRPGARLAVGPLDRGVLQDGRPFRRAPQVSLEIIDVERVGRRLLDAAAVAVGLPVGDIPGGPRGGLRPAGFVEVHQAADVLDVGLLGAVADA